MSILVDSSMASSFHPGFMEECIEACSDSSIIAVVMGKGNGVDAVVPVESIRAISARFANTLYGFFLGKRAAYPVVFNYVRNTWGIYGLVKSMLNLSTGIFSFQFISMDGLDTMLENGSWFIRNNSLILKKSSYARAMVKVWADVEIKDTIVVVMLKLSKEGFYTCTVRVEYEWKPFRCACCKVFGHIQEECPKNPCLGVAKNLKKPSQIPK
nr:hypothetical protein [Tanacetum cinerariifolium]